MSVPTETDRLYETWSRSRAWTPRELQDLSRSGYRGIAVADRVALDAGEGLAGAEFVRLLREAAAAGLRVRWHGHVPEEAITLLRHLSPPYDQRSKGFAWRRPGTSGLTARSGPGFVVVEDRRSGRYRRSVIQEADERHALLMRAETYRRARQAEHLIQEGLALALGDWVVSLPIRPLRLAAAEVA